MRLSQLSTGEALDALCRLTPQIANILDDKEILDEIRGLLLDGKEQDKSDMTGRGIGMMIKLGKLIPKLLQRHQGDVYSILSVLNNKEPEDIASQSLMETMAQVREMFTDKELLAFFRSSTQQAVTE